MIWDDKENREKDDWGTYAHERAALEQFLADRRISEVVLFGGDIHASRVLRYNTRKSLGYDLVQFIASPIHANVIPTLNVYSPDLVRSGAVSPARLHARLINRHGARVFTYDFTADDLAVPVVDRKN